MEQLTVFSFIFPHPIAILLFFVYNKKRKNERRSFF